MILHWYFYLILQKDRGPFYQIMPVHLYNQTPLDTIERNQTGPVTANMTRATVNTQQLTKTFSSQQ